MKVNVRIFRDIDELKIWGNEFGFRFLRDPEDKTKYRVLLTDDDVDKLETFVRQQQAEIESMQERMIVAEKELNHMRSFFGCDPAYYGMTSSEPVAWMFKYNKIVDNNKPEKGDEHNWIPLYTHPAKTLTDEEITAVSKEIFKDYKNFHHYQIDFARAILRKAQEK